MQALAAEYGVIAIDLPGFGAPRSRRRGRRPCTAMGGPLARALWTLKHRNLGLVWARDDWPHEVQRRRRRDARVGSHLQVQVPVGADGGFGSTPNVVRPVDDSIAWFRGTGVGPVRRLKLSTRRAVGPAVTELSMRVAAEKCRPQQHDCHVDDCLVSTRPAVVIIA